jgi:prevent-host-death family protein
VIIAARDEEAMKSVWQLQEAKNQFSRVVERALTVGVQTITRHGTPVVVVVAAEAFRKAKPRRRTVDILRSCPGGGLDIHRVRDVPRATSSHRFTVRPGSQSFAAVRHASRGGIRPRA